MYGLSKPKQGMQTDDTALHTVMNMRMVPVACVLPPLPPAFPAATACVATSEAGSLCTLPQAAPLRRRVGARVRATPATARLFFWRLGAAAAAAAAAAAVAAEVTTAG